MKVGDAVKVVDEVGIEHDGLITAWWGGDNEVGACNAVFVSSDQNKHDPYGQQLERLSSLSHKSQTPAPGRYWY